MNTKHVIKILLDSDIINLLTTIDVTTKTVTDSKFRYVLEKIKENVPLHVIKVLLTNMHQEEQVLVWYDIFKQHDMMLKLCTQLLSTKNVDDVFELIQKHKNDINYKFVYILTMLTDVPLDLIKLFATELLNWHKTQAIERTNLIQKLETLSNKLAITSVYNLVTVVTDFLKKENIQKPENVEFENKLKAIADKLFEIPSSELVTSVTNFLNKENILIKHNIEFENKLKSLADKLTQMPSGTLFTIVTDFLKKETVLIAENSELEIKLKSAAEQFYQTTRKNLAALVTKQSEKILSTKELSASVKLQQSKKLAILAEKLLNLPRNDLYKFINTYLKTERVLLDVVLKSKLETLVAQIDILEKIKPAHNFKDKNALKIFVKNFKEFVLDFYDQFSKKYSSRLSVRTHYKPKFIKPVSTHEHSVMRALCQQLLRVGDTNISSAIDNLLEKHKDGLNYGFIYTMLKQKIPFHRIKFFVNELMNQDLPALDFYYKFMADNRANISLQQKAALGQTAAGTWSNLAPTETRSQKARNKLMKKSSAEEQEAAIEICKSILNSDYQNLADNIDSLLKSNTATYTFIYTIRKLKEQIPWYLIKTFITQFLDQYTSISFFYEKFITIHADEIAFMKTLLIYRQPKASILSKQMSRTIPSLNTRRTIPLLDIPHPSRKNRRTIPSVITRRNILLNNITPPSHTIPSSLNITRYSSENLMCNKNYVHAPWMKKFSNKAIKGFVINNDATLSIPVVVDNSMPTWKKVNKKWLQHACEREFVPDKVGYITGDNKIIVETLDMFKASKQDPLLFENVDELSIEAAISYLLQFQDMSREQITDIFRQHRKDLKINLHVANLIDSIEKKDLIHFDVSRDIDASQYLDFLDKMDSRKRKSTRPAKFEKFKFGTFCSFCKKPDINTSWNSWYNKPISFCSSECFDKFVFI